MRRALRGVPVAVPSWALAVALAGLTLGGVLFAQEGQEDPEPPADQAAEPDTIQLVFEREVFQYPATGRRNPFEPLADGGDAGPRFEQLVFLGAISTSDPTSSVALLGIRSGDGTDRTYRLRAGQSIGNTRVLEIRPRELVVEVEEFGLTERRTMRPERTAPEASREEEGPDPSAEPSGDPDDPAGDTTGVDPGLDQRPGRETGEDSDSGATGATTNGNGGT